LRHGLDLQQVECEPAAQVLESRADGAVRIVEVNRHGFEAADGLAFGEIAVIGWARLRECYGHKQTN